MVGDLAFLLRSRPCGDMYVAYLPPSEVSWVSIAIICYLGATSIVVSFAAIMSFSITRNIFNWNASYERVINLAASSGSIPLPGGSDLSATAYEDVVIEQLRTDYGQGLHVHILPVGAPSTPIPGASHKVKQSI